MTGRAIAGVGVGALGLMTSVGLGLIFRQHGVVDGSSQVFQTLLGLAFAAAASSVGTGIGAIIASSDRLRGAGELPTTVALGIVSLVGLAMALTLSALYMATPLRHRTAAAANGVSPVDRNSNLRLCLG